MITINNLKWLLTIVGVCQGAPVYKWDNPNRFSREKTRWLSLSKVVDPPGGFKIPLSFYTGWWNQGFPYWIIIIPNILGRFGQYNNPRTNHQATRVLNTAHLKTQQFWLNSRVPTLWFIATIEPTPIGYHRYGNMDIYSIGAVICLQVIATTIRTKKTYRQLSHYFTITWYGCGKCASFYPTKCWFHKYILDSLGTIIMNSHGFKNTNMWNAASWKLTSSYVSWYSVRIFWTSLQCWCAYCAYWF